MNVVFPESYNAGNKAKSDICFFLEQENFETIVLDGRFMKTSKLSKFQHANEILAPLDILNEDDIFIYQYPSIGRVLEQKMIRKLDKIGAKKVAVIHDVDSLRYHFSKMEFYKNVAWEAKFLNHFDIIISSNEVMTRQLRLGGLTVPTVDLKVFDYETRARFRETSSPQKNVVSFAGNLNKSQFVSHLRTSNDLSIQLYGTLKDQKILDESVEYKGVFPADTLPEQLESGFGLVWDGDKTSQIHGGFGTYMRYNNPHKVSLYLASGIPVIIWDEAAMASFINHEKLGITVSSIEDIDAIISKISTEDYTNMLVQVHKYSKRVREGYFIKNAVKQVLTQLDS
jgi:glycosyltransferase involved in cell wall biosynthesis